MDRIDPSTLDLSRLDEVVFRHGSHKRPEDGMCVMEAVAWVAGVGHTDLPPCVPSEISRLAQRINDADVWDSDEQRTEALRPLIPLMLRASHAPEARTQRGYLAAHFAVQKAADALDSAGLEGEAAKLRVVPLPTSLEECLALRSAAQEAHGAAADAADAAAYHAAAAAAAYRAADAAAAAAADAADAAAYYADDAADAAAYYADDAAACYAADAYRASAAAYRASAAASSSQKPEEALVAPLVRLLRAFCEVSP